MLEDPFRWSERDNGDPLPLSAMPGWMIAGAVCVVVLIALSLAMILAAIIV